MSTEPRPPSMATGQGLDTHTAQTSTSCHGTKRTPSVNSDPLTTSGPDMQLVPTVHVSARM